MSVVLKLGDATQSDDEADLVFCHPYAALPKQLIGVPALINLFGNKKRIAEQWIGAPLAEVSKWGRGYRNVLYVAHLPVLYLDLTDLIEDEIAPRTGFMPIELPLRVLRLYGVKGMTVWDGFMGRGTIGKACQALEMNYIGIDNDTERVAMARKYLGV